MFAQNTQFQDDIGCDDFVKFLLVENKGRLKDKN